MDRFSREIRQNELWPTIHNALDVYYRRKKANAEPYELIWRLIHVWESIIICLGSTVIARVYSLNHNEDLLLKKRKIRELCYGVTYDENDQNINKISQSAFDGSINEWTNILNYIASQDFPESIYLTNIKNFLNSIDNKGEKRNIDLGKLYDCLNRVCVVPFSNDVRVDIKTTFRYVNQFRNKFAHIPFPYDRIKEIYEALEYVTFELIETSAYCNNPLHGKLAKEKCRMHGNILQDSEDNDTMNELSFIFKDGDNEEIWPTYSFVYVDQMMRIYILTRILLEKNSLEYTRYLAEGNPVIEMSEKLFDDFISLFPKPIPNEYIRDKDQDNKVDNDEIKNLLKNRNFKMAIDLLSQLVKEDPSYHVNWERLGYAYREYAILQDNNDEKKEYLKNSILCFRKAMDHISKGFRAEVYYQCSKSYIRLYQITRDNEDLKNSNIFAEKAISSEYQDRFISWNEYLKSMGLSKIEDNMKKIDG